MYCQLEIVNSQIWVLNPYIHTYFLLEFLCINDLALPCYLTHKIMIPREILTSFTIYTQNSSEICFFSFSGPWEKTRNLSLFRVFSKCEISTIIWSITDQENTPLSKPSSYNRCRTEVNEIIAQKSCLPYFKYKRSRL